MTRRIYPHEVEAAGKRIIKKVRAENFALGLPVTYTKDGVVVREYADGTIESACDETGQLKPMKRIFAPSVQ